ncbi:hypothetical protein HHJ81_09390 [Mobiluncus mulieris]|uniref:Uncharacterized protein n=2 Tax=Mobiluncus mulieris TaxID=2052 RepID=E0QN88_9ACTO|nr:hypothetical protein HMPREF0577_1993 [Mobiluncus mulieris ATCC 35243]EFM46860.1 hypothetical protein HMPREF0580_0352 [Mobiluncus mulieris ATCC 35239]MCU9971807.1 hypothetical protein [Mobiluncus mulieris]MCU9975039.1 hypothetical protein [Mobiluncus mulieris]MCU9994678.1 hypothetical protein [Mobiluncus mulieris]
MIVFNLCLKATMRCSNELLVGQLCQPGHKNITAGFHFSKIFMRLPYLEYMTVTQIISSVDTVVDA